MEVEDSTAYGDAAARQFMARLRQDTTYGDLSLAIYELSFMTLTWHSDPATAMRRRLVAVGLLPFLKEVCLDANMPLTNRSLALMAIWNFGEREAERRQLVDVGVVEILPQFLQNENRPLQHAAIGVLRNLLGFPDVQLKAAELGIIEQLLMIAPLIPPLARVDDVLTVVSALGYFAMQPQLHERLLRAGALSYFISTLTNLDVAAQLPDLRAEVQHTQFRLLLSLATLLHNAPKAHPDFSPALQQAAAMLPSVSLLEVVVRERRHVYIPASVDQWVRLADSLEPVIRRIAAFFLAVQAACGTPSSPRRQCDDQRFLFAILCLMQDPDPLVAQYAVRAQAAVPLHVARTLQWRPDRHPFFPETFRSTQRHLLLSAEKARWRLPPELWTHLLAFTTIDWFP
jgi:hypothetical protein